MTRPRVLYALNGFNRGGAELGLKTMLEHGFGAGCDFRVFAIHEGAADIRAAIERLVGPGCVTMAVSGPGLTASGVIAAFRALRDMVAEFRPHVVVLSLRQTNILGRAILRRWPHIRCIAFEHMATLERGRLTPIYERLLRLLSARVDEVWGDCLTTLEGARRYYRSAPRTERVVPLFVAPDRVRRKASYLAGSPIRLVSAGRLIPRKQIDVGVKAVAALRGLGHPATLTIFGDGPERDRLATLTRHLGIADAVRFAGHQPNWYEQAADHDLFLHLSQDEGFCIVVAEAMLVGLPVIATPVGGVREYSDDGTEAIHARNADPAHIAALVSGLLADEGRRRALGTAAAARISSLYARASAVSQYQTLTRALVPREATRRSSKDQDHVGFRPAE